MAQYAKRQTIRLTGCELPTLELLLHIILPHRLGKAHWLRGGNVGRGVLGRGINLQVVAHQGRGEPNSGRIEILMGFGQQVAGRGLAVPPATLQRRRPPALDGPGDDRHRPVTVLILDEAIEGIANGIGIVPVSVTDRKPCRFKLGRQGLGRLLRTDLVRLAVAVAVEDRQYVGERVISDEVDGLGDLALTSLAVADDAVDALLQAIASRGDRQAGRNREAMA